MIYIITPCTRTFNLERMSKSIPKDCKWVIVYDSTIKNKTTVSNAINVYSERTGGFGNPNRNLAIETIKDQLTDDDWLYVLDDDNIIHPEWYDGIKDELQGNSMLHWSQIFPNGAIRAIAPEQVSKNSVDTAQYMVRWGAVKNIRYQEIYEADGIYAEDCQTAAGGSKRINKTLCYYNYLRPNKLGNKLWAKICMISMFKNEAQNIRQMLDSVAPYIDYWVLQDNGSTDGTPEIVKQWAEEVRIPGMMYQVEEGWVNFGWNRDHLLQTTLKLDHACDWIMKMDCDETLEVDDNYDWKDFFIDKSRHSFHVTATTGGLVYLRAWIWNAKLPWRFNHDPAHETILLDMDNIGENFDRHNLPYAFRMRAGVSKGESYTVPTKYVSDALKLEEKLIREGTMLTDLYHFWYIGKSYEDCYRGDFFPLKGVHQQEYARRCIFYFTEVANVRHNFKETGRANHIDEMGYYAICAIGNAYRFLGEHTKAIEHYKMADSFCPRRNDHLLYLAEIHWELRDYSKMLYYTTLMMQSDRTCPFPEFYFLVNRNMYHDGGTYVKQLHEIALDNINKAPEEFIFSLAAPTTQKKRVFVVDNFYNDPHSVRNFALQQQYEPSSDWYKGSRTYKQFLTPQIKKAFEDVMGIKIRNWETHGMNGKFQYCVPENPLVYHYDSQTWAALIYLTPDAPFSTGTSLYAHKETKIRHIDEHPDADSCFRGGFYDSTKFELVDTIGNVFNRLVIFDARTFHAATGYFGKDITDSRLFQIFFFD